LISGASTVVQSRVNDSVRSLILFASITKPPVI
jgi:hypothetical protein